MRVAAPAPGSEPAVAIPLLLDRYGPRLHGLAARLCGNRADADDLVQDVFLTAFRRWRGFRGESDPGTWLYTIAARACARRMGKRAGGRTLPAARLMPWNEATVMQAAAARKGEEDPVERREAVARVQSAVSRLDEHLRVPLVMKEMLGLSVEETAESLGLAVNTVKTRLHRARLALRKAMTAKGAAVAAPAPIYEKQVCLDLLKAKMEAMDRGGVSRGFRVPQGEVCARCRAVFRELDLVQDACAAMSDGGPMPERLRSSILSAVGARDRAAGGPAKPRRGRRPARASRAER